VTGTLNDMSNSDTYRFFRKLKKVGWFAQLSPLQIELAKAWVTFDRSMAYDDSSVFDFGDDDENDECTPKNCLHGTPRALFDRERIYRHGDYTYLLYYFREPSYGLISPVKISETWDFEGGGLLKLAFENNGREKGVKSAVDCYSVIW